MYKAFNRKQTNKKNYLFMLGWEEGPHGNVRSCQTSTEHKYFVKLPKKYLPTVIIIHLVLSRAAT